MLCTENMLSLIHHIYSKSDIVLHELKQYSMTINGLKSKKIVKTDCF